MLVQVQPPLLKFPLDTIAPINYYRRQMGSPATLDLGVLVQGDTWRGVPEIIAEVADEAPESPLEEVYLQFRKSPESQAKVTLSSGNGIMINNAATWSVTIPEQPLNLTPGDWIANLRFIDSAGRVSTWSKITLKVEATTTRQPYRNNS